MEYLGTTLNMSLEKDLEVFSLRRLLCEKNCRTNVQFDLFRSILVALSISISLSRTLSGLC